MMHVFYILVIEDKYRKLVGNFFSHVFILLNNKISKEIQASQENPRIWLRRCREEPSNGN